MNITDKRLKMTHQFNGLSNKLLFLSVFRYLQQVAAKSIYVATSDEVIVFTFPKVFIQFMQFKIIKIFSAITSCRIPLYTIAGSSISISDL